MIIEIYPTSINGSRRIVNQSNHLRAAVTFATHQALYGRNKWNRLTFGAEKKKNLAPKEKMGGFQHITTAYLGPAGMLRIAGPQMAWNGCAAVHTRFRAGAKANRSLMLAICLLALNG